MPGTRPVRSELCGWKRPERRAKLLSPAKVSWCERPLSADVNMRDCVLLNVLVWRTMDVRLDLGAVLLLGLRPLDLELLGGRVRGRARLRLLVRLPLRVLVLLRVHLLELLEHLAVGQDVLLEALGGLDRGVLAPPRVALLLKRLDLARTARPSSVLSRSSCVWKRSMGGKAGATRQRSRRRVAS